MVNNKFRIDAFNNLIQSKSFVLADFYSESCEPCKMLDGILNGVQTKMGLRLFIQKIDIDISKKLSQSYEVMSVPVLILFKNGEPIWRMNGFLAASDLIKTLEEFIKE